MALSCIGCVTLIKNPNKKFYIPEFNIRVPVTHASEVERQFIHIFAGGSMPKAVICMAKTQTQAQVIITRLQYAGIASEDVSIVMSDHSNRFGYAPNSEVLLALLKGVGRIVITGVGFFVAAGPLLSAIHESPKSTLAGVAGALVSFGFPEYEASRHQDLVKSGAILICLHTSNSDEAQRINEILENTDAEDISTAGEDDLADVDPYPRKRIS